MSAGPGETAVQHNYAVIICGEDEVMLRALAEKAPKSADLHKPLIRALTALDEALS